MALYSLTKWELIERIGILTLRDGAWRAGTLTGGTTGTFVDTINRYESNDYFNTTTPKSRIHVFATLDGGAPQGEERTITDWDAASFTGTVVPVFSATLAGGDRYVILSEYSWDEIGVAINMSIDEIAKRVFLPVVDDTTLLADSVFDYPVPTGLLHVSRLTMEDATGTFSDPLPADAWEIIKGANPMIRLRRLSTRDDGDGVSFGTLWADAHVTDGRILRVEGWSAPSYLVADTDICNVDPIFLVHRAAQWLHSNRIRRSDNEPDEHRTQSLLHKAEADAAKSKIQTVLPPGTRRVEA